MKRIGKGISPTGEAIDLEWNEVPLRRYIALFAFIFFTAGFSFYWAGFPLLNTIFTDGYPQFGIPPSPGAYMSDR